MIKSSSKILACVQLMSSHCDEIWGRTCSRMEGRLDLDQRYWHALSSCQISVMKYGDVFVVGWKGDQIFLKDTGMCSVDVKSL